MLVCYSEDYLFIQWALKHLPFPRNAAIHVDTCSYGLRAVYNELTVAEKQLWEEYRGKAQSALGDRFIADRS